MASGVEGEAKLARLAAGREPDPGEGLLGGAVVLVELVDVAHLTASVKLQIGEISLFEVGVEELRGHIGILQAENVAYSNVP